MKDTISFAKIWDYSWEVFKDISTGAFTKNSSEHFLPMAYYTQIENKITNRAFLMNTELVAETDLTFSSLPILPRVRFYTCRNFIILKDKSAD